MNKYHSKSLCLILTFILSVVYLAPAATFGAPQNNLKLAYKKTKRPHSEDVSLEIIPAIEPHSPEYFPPFPRYIDIPMFEDVSSLAESNNQILKNAATKSSTSSKSDKGGDAKKLALNEDTPLGLNNLGVREGSKGNWEEAIRFHIRAVNGDPYRVEFKKNLSSANLRYGDLLRKAGDNKKAMYHFREALYADSNNIPARKCLDKLLKDSGGTPEDPAYRLKLGEQFLSRKNYPMALVELRIYSQLADSGQAYVKFGEILLAQKRTVEGYKQLAKAVNKKWPAGSEKELGRVHAKLGKLLKTFADVARSQGRKRASYLRYKNASCELRRAVTFNPEDNASIEKLISISNIAINAADTFNNNMFLACANQLAGNFEQAKVYYANCWRLNPNDPRLLRGRTSYHLSVISSPNTSSIMKEKTTAKVAKTLAKRPDDALALYIYGKGKENLHDSKSALLAYKKAYKINPLVHPDLVQGIERLTGSSPGGNLIASKHSPRKTSQNAPSTKTKFSIPISSDKIVKDKWAVIVGISKFKDPSMNLQFAAKDAKDFAQFLTTKENFAKDHVKLMIDGNATRTNILSVIGDSWLPRVARPDDLVVIYLSTHGSPSDLDVGGVNYLIAHDTSVKQLYATGIAMQDLARMIKARVHSKRVVIVLDACYSGATRAKAKGLFRPGNIDVSSFVQGTGQLVISSSSPNQRSWESKNYQGGVFTKHLIEALQLNGSRTTLGEAFAYLKDKVETEVQTDRGVLQTPVLKSQWKGADLLLGVPPAHPRPPLKQNSQ